MEDFKYEYRHLESGEIEIVKVIGIASEMTVPSTIDGYRIARIASFAFTNI